MDYMDRRLKEFLLEQKQAMKSKDVFLVCCFKCDEVVCLSEHIVLFGENRYTCIEPDFDDYILVTSISWRLLMKIIINFLITLQ